MVKSKETGSANDVNCVLQLTEAEKRSKEVIDGARKRKAYLIKKAKDDSTREIEAFRKENEMSLARAQKDYDLGNNTNAAQLDKTLQLKQAELYRAYQAGMRGTLETILRTILTVQPEFHENLRE